MAENPEAAETPATPATPQAPESSGRVSRIGLVGMGRVGRNLCRLLYDSDDLALTALSTAIDPAALVYLLRFDTLLGRFPAPVSVAGDALHLGGRQVRLLPDKPPGEIPWGELGIDTVVDATPGGRTRAELERHFVAGARRVFLCAPAAEPPDVTAVPGLNDDELRGEQRIVFLASPLIHALAPVAKVLLEAFGIRRAFLTLVQAYSEQQHLADMPAAEPRRGRAAAENVVLQRTGAAQALGWLVPELRGKVTGLAMNVPVADGSVADLVCWHERPVTVEEVNRTLRDASAGRLAGILDYEDQPIVSSDALHRESSGTFDSLATMVLAGNVSKTLTWFDNGWGYAHRLMDLIRRFREIDARVPAGAKETGR